MSTAVGDFRRGAGHAFAGLTLITGARARLFVVVPLLVNVVVFAVAIAWLTGTFGGLIEQATARLPQWLDWLRWLLWPLFVASVALLGFYSFTLVANVLGSPFNGLLAERIEDLLDPDAGRPPSPPFMRELVAAPLMELRKLGGFALMALPFLLLFVVPGVNVIAPLLWFGFSAWTLALEYADYPMGNHRIPYAEQKRLLARRRMLALGFGAAVLGMTLVPIVNFLVMPAAVAGATRLWVTEFGNHRRQ